VRIGAYEVLGPVAGGAPERDWEGRGADGRTVLLRRLLPGERVVSRNLGEAQGFVPALEAVVGVSFTAVVTPLPGGGSLRRRLETGPLSIQDVTRIAVGVGKALGHAHARGLVLGALVPEDVWFGRDDRPLVLPPGGVAHAPARGPDLRAPELRVGEAPTASSDVFALGAILFECLLGDPPMLPGPEERAQPADVRLLLRRTRRDTPPSLARLVARALAAEPEARFADGAALARAAGVNPSVAAARIGGVTLALLALGVAAAALNSAPRPARARPTLVPYAPPAPPAPPPRPRLTVLEPAPAPTDPAKLDPNDDRDRQALLRVAREQDWIQRLAAARALSTRLEPGTVAALEQVLAGPEPLEAEVVATAFGLSRETDRVAAVASALSQAKDFRVRRAAALALGELATREAVDALVAALDREAKDVRVLGPVLDALEAATGDHGVRAPDDWRRFWRERGAAWTQTAAPDPEPREEWTTPQGTTLAYRIRGGGEGSSAVDGAKKPRRPLIAIADFGWDADFLERALRPIALEHPVLTIGMPPIRNFVPAVRALPGQAVPDYPVDRLALAIDQLVGHLEAAGRFPRGGLAAVLGQGPGGSLAAMRYATNARSVKRVVLCGAVPSAEAFERDRQALHDEAARAGDRELEHAATLVWDRSGEPRFEAASEEYARALERRAFTSAFGDAQDLEIGRLYGRAGVLGDMGDCRFPDFDVADEPRSRRRP
jgi:hypothetical protein